MPEEIRLRFLEREEFEKTIPLFVECFGADEEFLTEYYGEALQPETAPEEPAAEGEQDAYASEREGKHRPFVFQRSGGRVEKNRIAVAENDIGEIKSMVHVQPMTAVYENGEVQKVSYLLCIGTEEAVRGCGLMSRLLQLVTAQLQTEGEPWCFLVAVDKNIYRPLGFVHDWRFRPEEAELLSADEGLTECSAALLQPELFRNGGCWQPPIRLKE